jgi:hypothetical protein
LAARVSGKTCLSSVCRRVTQPPDGRDHCILHREHVHEFRRYAGRGRLPR